jgi:hypothetical protein
MKAHRWIVPVVGLLLIGWFELLDRTRPALAPARSNALHHQRAESERPRREPPATHDLQRRVTRPTTSRAQSEVPTLPSPPRDAPLDAVAPLDEDTLLSVVAPLGDAAPLGEVTLLSAVAPLGDAAPLSQAPSEAATALQQHASNWSEADELIGGSIPKVLLDPTYRRFGESNGAVPPIDWQEHPNGMTPLQLGPTPMIEFIRRIGAPFRRW